MRQADSLPALFQKILKFHQLLNRMFTKTVNLLGVGRQTPGPAYLREHFMKSGIPWSVKGIEPEAREAAKDAARKSGQTLGEWLNSVIIEQAEAGAAPRSQPTPPPARNRFGSIAQELAMMTVPRPTATAGSYFESGPAAAGRVDFNAVLERVENNERYLTEALSSINERLKAINAQIAKQPEASAAQAEHAAGYEAMEAAVRNIIAHLEVSERRTHDALREVQEQVSSLSRPESQITDAGAARLQQVEDLLAGFAARLDAHGGDDGEQRYAALKTQIERLSEHLASLQKSSATMIEQAKSAALTSMRAEFKELERHVQSLSSDARSSLQQSAESRADIARSQADIARVKADIGGLARRIDDLKGEAAAERDVQSLRTVIEQLSGRIAKLPIGDMEKRLNDFALRISDVEIRGRALPQVSEVAERVADLEELLSKSGSATDDFLQDGLDSLQEQIRRLDGRLADTDERLSSIAGIELSISQLFQALEDDREDVPHLAEEAAKRVMQELLQQAPVSAAADPSPQVAALEEALAALRQQSVESTQQTQETFDALHDTMEAIVNKLTELEAGGGAARSTNREEVSRNILPLPVHGSPVAQLDVPKPAEPEALAWQSAVHEHLAKGKQDLSVGDRAHPSKAEELDSDLFAPPEAVAIAKPSAASAARSASKEEDDFIAAARRAAQAAAHGSKLGIGRLPSSGPEAIRAKPWAKSTLPKFSLSVFRRSPALKPRRPKGVADDIAAAADTATLPPDTGRRRLLLAALLLLAAVSAFALRSGQKDTPPPQVPPSLDETRPPAASPASRTQDIEPQQRFADATLAAGLGPEAVRQAAMNGRPEAQFMIAGQYLEGGGAAPNASEAAKWYHKAARQGLAPAQYRLATLFERGAGVERNAGRAIFWYEKAAAQGHVKAMHNLGVLLASDQHSDPAAAARWFTAAARHGLKDSQYNLALFYERGLGVSEDLAEAFFWYSAAAGQGDHDALARAEAIADSLPLAQKSAARQRLREWRPMEAAKEVNVVALSSDRG